jgi:hypothetical protein
MIPGRRIATLTALNAHVVKRIVSSEAILGSSVGATKDIERIETQASSQ